MKKFIQENWFKVGLLAILIFSIAGAFYWFSWRPTQIKQRCSIEARLGGLVALSRSSIEINAYYEDCLMRFGLK
ncbi:MAG: hypothetical protein Q8Q46_00755 [Candidatus Giovannonibacteria bacterium]|nr:hypothetical protein [Candidatus Giovannonibacteria bacterium]